MIEAIASLTIRQWRNTSTPTAYREEIKRAIRKGVTEMKITRCSAGRPLRIKASSFSWMLSWTFCLLRWISGRERGGSKTGQELIRHPKDDEAFPPWGLKS